MVWTLAAAEELAWTPRATKSGRRRRVGRIVKGVRA
jgi:hypothetical protein